MFQFSFGAFGIVPERHVVEPDAEYILYWACPVPVQFTTYTLEHSKDTIADVVELFILQCFIATPEPWLQLKLYLVAEFPFTVKYVK